MKSLRGSIVALVTPFKEGRLDLPVFEKLIRWHLSQGTHGILVCGSTGEGSLLSLDEQRTLIIRAAELINGAVPLLVGATHMSTAGAIQLARQGEALGADVLLVAPPPYLKPTQNALYDHFLSICESCTTPIILYNHPGRTGVELSEQLIERLSKIPGIIGLKEVSNDLTLVKSLRKKLPEPFLLFCGEDSSNADYLRLGANGYISMTVNVAPQQMSSLYEAWIQKDEATFNTIDQRFSSVYKSMGLEGNPVSVKGALALMGKCLDEMRAPLQPLSEDAQRAMRPILDAAGLLDGRNAPIIEEAHHGT
ncbi:MAG: 4-hydroxy-tetrahydrodipicolinate synthase [bacterium]|nr:4-hydroxy-tetrahydrodipicolinate synthase [bacterium]